MAVGRLPESGADLCSQPTVSRLENLPGPVALKRMMAAMVELFCDSFGQVSRRIVLDIDDTEDRVHGGQQLALFNAHYDSRCFQPIHIYEAASGKPVAIILRPGKTPDGAEVALVLRHVIGRIRARWPAVEIVVRGDSHYGRPEAMAWCERKRIGYIFGLAGNAVLLGRVSPLAEDAAIGRIGGEGEKVRRYGDFRYAAKSWTPPRTSFSARDERAFGCGVGLLVHRGDRPASPPGLRRLRSRWCGLRGEPDHPLHVVDEVGEADLGSRSGDAYRANIEAHRALLPGKDMLDRRAHCGFAAVGPGGAPGHWLAPRLLAVDLRAQAVIRQVLLIPVHVRLSLLFLVRLHK